MSHRVRTRPTFALLLATVMAVAASLQAVEAQTIEKAQNKSLTGTAYARLRSLTYDQCEARCLNDAQCVAFEHYRGGGIVRRSSNCALFSATRSARESQYSDVGYKRQSAAAAETSPKRSLRTDGNDGARGSGGALHRPQPSILPSPAAPSAVSPAEQATRVQAEQARQAREAAARAQSERARQDAEAAARTYRNGAAKSAPVTSAAPASEPRFGGSPAPTTRGPSPVAPPAAAPPPPGATASGGFPSGGSAPGAAQPSPAPGPAAPPASSTRSVRPVTAAPPVPVVPAAVPDFHIVPVFYGTDRNRSDSPKRIAYANDRARRLEMGRALVTVPTNHKVPNIERPAAWSIPYFGKIWEEAEDPKKHFTIRQIDALTKVELLALIKQRLGGSEAFKDQSIIFIHGYNIGFDDALYRTAQISYDLQFDGASFTYSWPAGSGWASYPYARDSAQQAERYLYEFLQMVQNETGTTSISIVAHSMGNQMLLQVLRSLKQRSPAVSKINQIILAAPDVDRDTFENLAGEISGVARGITLYAAGNDVALEASRYLAGNQFRAGDIGPNGPVIVEGIDSIDISSVSTSYLAINHSNYAEHSELLTDLKHLIRTGTRPPELRITNYKRIQAAQGVYWRYAN